MSNSDFLSMYAKYKKTGGKKRLKDFVTTQRGLINKRKFLAATRKKFLGELLYDPIPWLDIVEVHMPHKILPILKDEIRNLAEQTFAMIRDLGEEPNMRSADFMFDFKTITKDASVYLDRRQKRNLKRYVRTIQKEYIKKLKEV